MSIRDWFRRKPRQPPGDEDALIAMLQKRGLLPPGAKIAGVRAIPLGEAMSAGIEPPDGPMKDAKMPWATWQGTMAQMVVPGWSPCCFGARLYHRGHDDVTEFLWGIVRGPFGVYSRPHSICVHDDEEAEPEQILASLVHLPSGIGMTVFCDRPTACAAADALLSSNIGVPWEAMNEPPGHPCWPGVQAKTETAWRFHGFVVDEGRHAHVAPGGPQLDIWTRPASGLLEGRPEALS